MVRQGYSRPFACAVTAAGSIIGPTIPPSTLMVIYGSIMGVSIAGLFAAGVLPGTLICLLCMGVIADKFGAEGTDMLEVMLAAIKAASNKARLIHG